MVLFCVMLQLSVTWFSFFTAVSVYYKSLRKRRHTGSGFYIIFISNDMQLEIYRYFLRSVDFKLPREKLGTVLLRCKV